MIARIRTCFSVCFLRGTTPRSGLLRLRVCARVIYCLVCALFGRTFTCEVFRDENRTNLD